MASFPIKPGPGPGGLGSVEEISDVDFAPEVIAAIEQKVEARSLDRQHFDNVTLATL